MERNQTKYNQQFKYNLSFLGLYLFTHELSPHFSLCLSIGQNEQHKNSYKLHLDFVFTCYLGFHKQAPIHLECIYFV